MSELEEHAQPPAIPAADVRQTDSIYITEGMKQEIRQAEIVSNLKQYTFDPRSEESIMHTHEYAIVLTQDCDLLWDYQKRQKSEKGDLNGIILYEAEPVLRARSRIPPGNDLWKRIRNNKDERYHVLETVPPNIDLLAQGLPSLLIDFKRIFTVSPEEFYSQLNVADGAKRRCRLEMPYREHLTSRAAFYLQRVTLPKPDDI